MFDRGSGPPLIVVPGVQGRWEWMQPALIALSRSCRTISYSLCGDIGSGMPGIGSAGRPSPLEPWAMMRWSIAVVSSSHMWRP